MPKVLQPSMFLVSSLSWQQVTLLASPPKDSSLNLVTLLFCNPIGFIAPNLGQKLAYSKQTPKSQARPSLPTHEASPAINIGQCVKLSSPFDW